MVKLITDYANNQNILLEANIYIKKKKLCLSIIFHKL